MDLEKFFESKEVFPELSLDRNTVGKPKLLVKAEEYRYQFPEKWRHKEESAEQRNRELLGFFEMSDHLKEYYEEVKRREKNKIKREEEKRRQPRKLQLSLQFIERRSRAQGDLTIDGKSPEKRETFLEAEMKDVRDDEEDSLEFALVVFKAKNMHNGIEDLSDRMTKARVKVMLLAEGEERGTKGRTDYRFLLGRGSTRFEYKFVFRGYTKQELEKRYLIVTVKGSNERSKFILGQGFLCGSNTQIQTEDGCTRTGSLYEIEPMKEALENPGKNISVLLNVTEPFSVGQDLTSSKKSTKSGKGIGFSKLTPALKRLKL